MHVQIDTIRTGPASSPVRPVPSVPPARRVPAAAAVRGPAASSARVAAERPRVALIVETSLAPGREILQGVARYVRDHGPWSTFVEPRGLEEEVPGWLRAWDGHGVIARVQNRRIADAVLAAGVPVVDVLGVVQVPGLPLVHTDDERIGALAAEHFQERGLRHFAFVGLSGENWSQRRRDAFLKSVAARARSCTVYETPRGGTGPWEERADDLATWVAALPKPAGLMLCSDQCGPAVLEACWRAGVDVPDELAVLGVDDDEPLCEVAEPGLSSVWPDHTQVGYRAAELLDRLMRGGVTARGGPQSYAGPVLVLPRGLVTRRSTDVFALDDREVAAAVRVIRDRACDPDGLTIDDVAAEVSISRSVLQRRFKDVVGRTLHDEMLRVRLARARVLLADTDLSITAVAERAGFRHREYMGAVFRQRLGVTPAQYRREHRR